MFWIPTAHCFSLGSMIHNIYVCSPWYTIFTSVVHDTQYFISGIHDPHCFCLVTMIHNIYVWIKSLILFIADLTPSNFPFLISEELKTMVYLSQSRHEICAQDPLCPAPWPDRGLMPIWSRWVTQCDLHAILLGNTQPHSHTL